MTRTLITGADGHVGKAVANWLLEHTNDDLLLFIRAHGSEERKEKTRNLGDLAGRCDVVFGDLADDKPFVGIRPDTVGAIIHSAAVTSFAVERDLARTVNVEGTAKLIEFARSCPSLRRFSFISSLYSAGLRDGAIEEVPHFDPAPFANHYEWSKWNAERLLYDCDDLPWQILRVATILGESSNGDVAQQNVIHNTLRLLYYGLLSVIPGNPGTRVYLTTTDYVAAGIGRLFTEAGHHSVFHLSEPGSSAVTLGELADTVYETFLADPKFARQRILKPLFCDRQAFDTLTGSLQSLGGASSQALQSVAPFAPQLFSDKDIRTTRTSEALGTDGHVDARTLLRRVATHLVDTRWGLRETTRNPR